MPSLSLKEKLSIWETLSVNLKAQLEEVPHLSEDQSALERLTEEGRALEAQQGIHMAALRETNRQRLDLERRGDELRDRMAGALRHKYGPTSKRLHEFGLKPKAERRRRLTLEEKQQKLELRRQRLEEAVQKLALQAQRLEPAANPAAKAGSPATD